MTDDMEGEKKDERVTVLLTKTEHDNLKELVWKLKTDKSKFLRELFLDRYKKLSRGQVILESFEEQKEKSKE